MNAVRAYEYLTLSRTRLFDWIRPLSQEEYTRSFPIGLHTIRATMMDIACGEWAFTQRLRQEPLPPYEEWPFREERLPTFSAFGGRMGPPCPTNAPDVRRHHRLESGD